MKNKTAGIERKIATPTGELSWEGYRLLKKMTRPQFMSYIDKVYAAGFEAGKQEAERCRG